MTRGKTQRDFYVIAYDIPSDRRRTKVHKTLCGFGEWTQYSLFECYLTDKEMLILRDKIDRLLNPDEDTLRFYPLCLACVDKVDTIGSPKPEEKTTMII